MKKITLFLAIFSAFLCVNLSAKVYKVGTSAGYAPFEYIENGKLVGFDIDIVNAVAKELGIEVEFVNMDFDGLIAALKMGKVDFVAAGMGKTPARAKNAEFSDTYYHDNDYVLKLKDNDALNSIADLNKKLVGAQIGTLQADHIKKIDGAKSFLNADLGIIVLKLVNKQIDAAIITSSIAKGYMEKYPQIVKFDTMKSESKGVSMAFAKGNIKLKDDVNAALKKIKENGIHQKLLDKYGL